MNTSRVVSFVGAAILTATEWAGFASPQLDTQLERAATAQVAGDRSDPALPVIVVMADRQR